MKRSKLHDAVHPARIDHAQPGGSRLITTPNDFQYNSIREFNTGRTTSAAKR